MANVMGLGKKLDLYRKMGKKLESYKWEVNDDHHQQPKMTGRGRNYHEHDPPGKGKKLRRAEKPLKWGYFEWGRQKNGVWEWKCMRVLA